jgi:hypothetical protein
VFCDCARHHTRKAWLLHRLSLTHWHNNTSTLPGQQPTHLDTNAHLLASLPVSHIFATLTARPKLTIHLQPNPNTNNMPKEKVTRGKGKAAAADSGKKKKGTSITSMPLNAPY